MAYRKRGYKRRLNRNYRTVRRYNSARRYKRTKNSLSYKVYALNRKVNKYISTYKPEIQQVRGNMITTEFKAGGHLNPIFSEYKNLYEQTLQVYNENPALRGLDVKNDLCRSFKLKFNGYFGLCPTYQKYEHDGDVAGKVDYETENPYPQTCYLKIVIATLKKGGGRVPQVGEVFESHRIHAGVGYEDLSLITGPLAKNITSQLNILRVKVVKVNGNNPNKLFKITLKVPHYRKRVNPQAFGSGEILVYYQLYCPEYLGEVGNIRTPDPRFSLDYQLLYVDQN